MIGVLPAILVVFIMRSIKEPEAWQEARETAADNLDRQLGDIKSLFGTPRWRRNTLVGVSLAVVGVIGLWGVGFYSPELIGEALKDLQPQEQDNVKAMGTLLQDVGALLGMLAFTYVATRMGRKARLWRRLHLLLGGRLGGLHVPDRSWHAYVMLPFLGFATLSLFGGYSIYFPELFPTRLRRHGNRVLLQRRTYPRRRGDPVQDSDPGGLHQRRLHGRLPHCLGRVGQRLSTGTGGSDLGTGNQRQAAADGRLALY